MKKIKTARILILFPLLLLIGSKSYSQDTWTSTGWCDAGSCGGIDMGGGAASCSPVSTTGGEVISSAAIDLTTTAFSFSFDLDFGDDGAGGAGTTGDGFVFIIAGSPPSAQGTGGQMGTAGLTVDFIAFEWDSYDNNAANTANTDGLADGAFAGDARFPTARTVSGDGMQALYQDYSVSPTESVMNVVSTPNLNNGSGARVATISWVPDGAGGGTFTQTLGASTLTAVVSPALLSILGFETAAKFSFSSVPNAGAVTGQQACVTQTAPVTLLNFSGNYTLEAINLNWSTATETNNRGFSLSRSYDGVNWEIIATETGKGEGTFSGITNYSYSDFTFAKGAKTILYKLKQTDLDGAYEEFPVISISTVPIDEIKIAPNPASDKITVNQSAESATFSFQSIQGGAVFPEVVNSDSFSSTFDVSTLPQGIYLMSIISESRKEVKRFVVSK